jgi:hypothetical protein
MSIQELPDKTFVASQGMIISQNETNKKKDKKALEWNMDYNGKRAHIDLDMNENGHRENLHMNLTNSDIMELLAINPSRLSLDKRLENDFLKHSEPRHQVPLLITQGEMPEVAAAFPLENNQFEMPPQIRIRFNKASGLKRTQSKKSKKSKQSKKSQKSKKSKKSKTRKSPLRSLLRKFI